MNACEQYFPVVLFIILHKVFITFESVDEVLKESYFEKNFPVYQLLHEVIDSHFGVCG